MRILLGGNVHRMTINPVIIIENEIKEVIQEQRIIKLYLRVFW